MGISPRFATAPISHEALQAVAEAVCTQNLLQLHDGAVCPQPLVDGVLRDGRILFSGVQSLGLADAVVGRDVRHAVRSCSVREGGTEGAEGEELSGVQDKGATSADSTALSSVGAVMSAVLVPVHGAR